MNTSFSKLNNEERQRVLGKLSKLKALSECPTGNVNETATAAAAMTRLMLEYQIEMAELSVQDDTEQDEACSEEVTGETSQRGFPVWQTHLLASLADVNDCILYVQSSVSRQNWQVKRVSVQRLIGSKRDIQSTRNIFQFCLVEIEKLWRLWDSRASLARRNDFRLGAAQGIGEKVRAERQAVLAEEKARSEAQGQQSLALAVFDRKQESADKLARDMGLRSRQARSRGVSPTAYQAGFEAGTNLELSQQPASLPESLV
jgi:hypothetical protein